MFNIYVHKYKQPYKRIQRKKLHDPLNRCQKTSDKTPTCLYDKKKIIEKVGYLSIIKSIFDKSPW